METGNVHETSDFLWQWKLVPQEREGTMGNAGVVWFRQGAS